MQVKFQNNELEPSTKIKKKLEETFGQMCLLLSHYIKLNLIDKFESGSRVDEVIRMSMSNCSTKNLSTSTGEKKFSVDNWIKNIKKANGDMDKKIYSQSMNTNSLSSKQKGGDQERLHMVYNKPKIFDKSKKSNNKSISNPENQD